ncbi:MAG: hypothetical protein QOJ69_2260 [Actinomycetota bacterium]|nr:hypothetical protein [Actinomycetota bacterium]
MDGDPTNHPDLERFCQREFPHLVGLLGLYCGDRSTAEDLAQETLARVWQRWERVSRLDAPELWARRVALNLANSWFRRRAAAGRAVARLAGQLHPGVVMVGTADVDLQSVLAGLAPRQRAVLVLRFYEDLSVSDTARAMRCREGAVKALTAQGLDALRRRGIVPRGVTDE